MLRLADIVAFWLIVIVAIRLAACFPRSLPARILFAPIGPVRARGEAETDYLRRWARCGIGWCAQAAALLVAGWTALRLDASLADSLTFVVLRTVVVPLIAVCALVLALGAAVRSAWSRRPGTSARLRPLDGHGI